jgi:hypothetical protein
MVTHVVYYMFACLQIIIRVKSLDFTQVKKSKSEVQL